MKKLSLLFIYIVIVFSTSSVAQVAINTDGSEPDNSAILEVKSTTQGLLIPRMTNTQIQYIANPASGLLVYSTDDSKTYCFHSGDNVWKELAIGISGITPYAVYSIGTGSSCSNTAISGPYNEGVTLIAPNLAIIDANITTPGDWSIATNTINGYGFSGSGTTTTTGTQQLTITGSGTPVTSQTDNFTATANNGGGTCTYNITVDLATYPSETVHCITGGTVIQNVINPTTGDIWMDRNLGAAQVATSSSDSDAYGDLYQWGRLSDGHQCRSSSTTTTLSSSDIPGHANFISAPNTPKDWRNPQNTDLWQGLNGTNNPCPSGYRIPTEVEWNNERLSWTDNNSNGAYNSPLKLTIGGFRYYSGGGFSGVNQLGYYWSSTIWRDESKYLYFSYSNDNANLQNNNRASGQSIRCIKEYYAVYTIGAGSSCDNTIINGIYQQGINMIATNTVTLDADFSSIGQWNITTNTVNGYSFSGSGTVASTGTHQIILTGSGVPSAIQTDSFTATANNGGGTCTFSITINAAPTYPSGTVHCIAGGTVIQNVYNPTTGEIWMDRNLGASQVATGEYDTDAYGDLYQWGRFSDGHQCRTSSTTTTLSSSNTPGHTNFILASNSPNDWRNPQNNNLWQGVNGANNPCPSGYRLPTKVEWDAEMLNWGAPVAHYAYLSPLKLPRSGKRTSSDGSINYSSVTGQCWSSSVSGSEAYNIHYRTGGGGSSYDSYRATGYSVRCIKEYFATYTIGSGSSCSNTTVDGPYQVGVMLMEGNRITIDVNFTTVGQWNITTNTNNGYSFSANGTVTSSGVQQLVLIGSGTPIAVQTDNFTATANNGGGTCTFSVTVDPVSTYPSGTVHCISGGAEIQNVYNPTTGKIWMDRNLGASQVATSTTDSDAYGDLYQWGRLSDGHQCRTSSTTTTLSSSDVPGHGNFIINAGAPYDWRSPQNDNLWQGVNGINNPCPDGYRIPTITEWGYEKDSWLPVYDPAFNSSLKLINAGYRTPSGVVEENTDGYYWANNIYGTQSRVLRFFSTGGTSIYYNYDRNMGCSIRCIRE